MKGYSVCELFKCHFIVSNTNRLTDRHYPIVFRNFSSLAALYIKHVNRHTCVLSNHAYFSERYITRMSFFNEYFMTYVEKRKGYLNLSPYFLLNRMYISFKETLKKASGNLPKVAGTCLWFTCISTCFT